MPLLCTFFDGMAGLKKSRTTTKMYVSLFRPLLHAMVNKYTPTTISISIITTYKMD